MKAKNKTKHLLLILFVATVFISCSTIEEYTDVALEMVGLTEPEKEEKKKKTKKAKATKKDTKAEAEEDSKKDDGPKIVINRIGEKTKAIVQKKDLKKTPKKEFHVAAPVHVKQRLRGVARKIFVDNQFVYLDFPQEFLILNQNLETQTKTSTASPVVNIRTISKNQKTYFAFEEEDHVLEIFEWDGQKNSSLKEIISYEMGGPFFWLNDTLVASIIDNKLQFLDFNNFEDIRILHEINQSNYQDIKAYDQYLMMARDEVLDIYDLKNHNTISSINIGRHFKIAGIFQKANQRLLTLFLTNEKNHLTGIQFLSLAAGKDLSINHFGEEQSLQTPLKDFIFDEESGLILGQEAGKGITPLQVYSMIESRSLRGGLSSETGLLSWNLKNGILYTVSKSHFKAQKVVLNLTTIKQTPQIEAEQKSAQATPLAQIGTQKTIKDEYSLTDLNKLDYSANAKRVFLLDASHLLMFEDTLQSKAEDILSTTDLQKSPITLSTVKAFQKIRYDHFLTSGFGLFLHSPDYKNIFLIDVDLKELKVLPIEIPELISWGILPSDDGALLFSTEQVKTKKKKSKTKTAYELDVTLLKSFSDFEVLKTIQLEDRPFVSPMNANEILVITQKEVSVYHKTDDNSLIKDSLETMPLNISQEILNVKISPKQDLGYFLIKENESYQIWIQDLTDTENHIILKNFMITPEHFQGSTFSKGGQLFILPSKDGTFFYDMTKLNDVDENDRVSAFWPLPSYWADIANQGRSICVALGAKGIYCGDLLFY